MSHMSRPSESNSAGGDAAAAAADTPTPASAAGESSSSSSGVPPPPSAGSGGDGSNAVADAAADAGRVAHVLLSESGCSFAQEVPVAPGETYASFKEKVEARYDQRLLLSFEQRVRQKQGAHQGLTLGTDVSPEIIALINKKRPPEAKTRVVALVDKTWPAFVGAGAGAGAPLRCRAWTVFPQQSLSSFAEPLSTKKVIDRFECGTETMPQEKKLAALKKKLGDMCGQQIKDDRCSRSYGKSSPDLFRTVSKEKAEQTVSRLWQHAIHRNAKRAEVERSEGEMMARKMRLLPRRVERSPVEEALVEKLADAPLQRRQQLEADLEEKYAGLQPRTRGVAQMPADAVAETVLRLFSASETIARKKDEAQKRVYGEGSPPKLLTKPELDGRLHSLYTKAIEKKRSALIRLEREYKSPTVSSRKLKMAEMRAVAERLATPHTRG